MFNRDHLVIGAVGFVLGGVVATASITAVLMTQSHEEKTCPPMPAIIAPQPTASIEAAPATPTATAAPATPATPTAAPAPVAHKTPPAAKAEKKLTSLDAEESDRLSEEQKQLLERKKNLASQLNDSNEIIRLKEQQIKELEEKLKQ